MPDIRSLGVNLGLAATIVVASRPALSQQPTSPAAAVAPIAATAPDITPEQALTSMRVELRNLVVAQERYWSQHGTYTTDAAALGTFPRSPVARRDSAGAQVIFAGGRGWTGTATHRALKGKSCVIFVGFPLELPKIPVTRGEQRLAEAEGVPTCDAP